MCPPIFSGFSVFQLDFWYKLDSKFICGSNWRLNCITFPIFNLDLYIGGCRRFLTSTFKGRVILANRCFIWLKSKRVACTCWSVWCNKAASLVTFKNFVNSFIPKRGWLMVISTCFCLIVSLRYWHKFFCFMVDIKKVIHASAFLYDVNLPIAIVLNCFSLKILATFHSHGILFSKWKIIFVSNFRWR